MSDLSDIVAALVYVAPEFVGEVTAKVEYFAQSCINETDKTRFPTIYINAMTNLTAHKLTKAIAVSGSAVGGAGSAIGSITGTVASIGVGDESIVFDLVANQRLPGLRMSKLKFD